MSVHLDKSVINEITEKYRVSDKDTSSADVHAALLTEKIRIVEDQLRRYPRDSNIRLVLLRLVGDRRKYLDYLNSTNTARYKTLIKRLNIIQ